MLLTRKNKIKKTEEELKALIKQESGNNANRISKILDIVSNIKPETKVVEIVKPEVRVEKVKEVVKEIDTEALKEIEEELARLTTRFNNRGGGSAPLWDYTGEYKQVTSTYQLTPNDYIVDAISGTFTITVPSATQRKGREVNIKNSGTGFITLATILGQTIDDCPTGTVILNPDDCLTLVANGSNWIII